MKQCLIIVLFAGLAACNKQKPSDPIVGVWHLHAIKDTAYHVLDTCELQSTIEATDDGTLIEKYFVADTAAGACHEYDNDEKWRLQGIGSYQVEHVSIVDQKQHINITGTTLIYYYEAWSNVFTGTGPIIVTPTWEYYVR